MESSDSTYLSGIHEIIVDENSPLFEKTNLFYKEFTSDYRQIRYFTLLICNVAPKTRKSCTEIENTTAPTLHQVCESSPAEIG